MWCDKYDFCTDTILRWRDCRIYIQDWLELQEISANSYFIGTEIILRFITYNYSYLNMLQVAQILESNDLT